MAGEKEASEALGKYIGRKMLPDEAIEGLCKTFKALGEPARMKLLLALSEGDLCVQHLTELSGGGQSAVSHQLRILRDGGWVRSRRVGKLMIYSLADEHVRKIIEMSRIHAGCEK